MTLFFLAIAAGALTILAPCILPILPIVLSVGSGSSKWRPLFVVIGFILSFSILGAFFTTAGNFLGVSNATFRWIAVVLLILFGLALLFEGVYQRLISKFSGLMSSAGTVVASSGSGKSQIVSGLLVGLSLGLVWTPCAGPILGTIITLAVTNGDTITTGLLFAAYALGAGIPMLGIAYGGSWVFTKLKIVGTRAILLDKIFGVLVILTALAIATGIDLQIQAYLIQWYPSGILML